MRFEIVGANAESGDDIDVIVEAPTPEDVAKIAHEKGILVSAIKPAEPPAGDPAHAHAGHSAGHGSAHGTPHGAHHGSVHGTTAESGHAPTAPKKTEDLGAIALVDDEPGAGDGQSDPHAAEHRPHGLITVNANSPGDTAHTGEGHLVEAKQEAKSEYHIIMNQSLFLLETAVNKHMREGWEPSGGMSVATSNNALNYFQSMVRHKK